jgi:hypothetical protein
MDRCEHVNECKHVNRHEHVDRCEQVDRHEQVDRREHVDGCEWVDRHNRWTDVNTDRLMWNRFTELKQKANVRIKQSQD